MHRTATTHRASDHSETSTLASGIPLSKPTGTSITAARKSTPARSACPTNGTHESEARRKIREAPIRHADDAESPRRTAGATPGATGSESRQARTGRESNAVGTPTYHDAYDVPPADVYDEAPPIQSARATHSGSPALSLASGADALSADARRQAEVERDLLCVMAVDPDSVRPFADRVASFAWTDPRYEAIAWSILATPVGTQPHEVVRAAEGVVPEAAGILSGGTYAGSDGASADKVPFLLDQVELFSTRRRVRRIKSRLRGSVSANDSQGLFQEATELQRRIGELEGHLAGYEGA